MVKYLKNNFGFFLVWILAIIPLVIWFFMIPLADRFSSFGQIFRSLGQITGLSGMALLSINFILSTRLKFLDKWFDGLNRVYIKHHTIGVIAFCLLLFHPTFLVIQYLFISLKASFVFIFSIQDLPTDLGKLGLLVFLVLMVITIYMNLKYQNWKNTHQYLGIVLFLGGLHMFLVPSDISGNAALKYYMFSLAVLGGISYIYRTVFSTYKKKEYKYKLDEVVKINENIVELKLKPLGQKINFLPGQFIFIRFETDGILSESHPFSITSYSENESLSLGIKTLGDYTKAVYLLKPGAICNIEGPFGAFSYLKAKLKRQIWIAGGIGITPFLSMARQIDASDKDTGGYKIDLYYSVKNENEGAFSEELEEISKKNNNFKFHKHFSDKGGYISAKFVTDNSNDLAGAEIFLCGPAGFMKSLREQFVNSGFNNNQIHSEEFSL
jgi:predicted ferric reductase